MIRPRAVGVLALALTLLAAPLAAEIDGIVTAPINKEARAAAGLKHSGHTENLAQLTRTRAYAMLLMGRDRRVIHVTTHVALRRVPELVTRERVLSTIRLGHDAMRRLGLAAPRIAVGGLNPHAGESGLFGDEEQVATADSSSPDIARAFWESVKAKGSLPVPVRNLIGTRVTLGRRSVRASGPGVSVLADCDQEAMRKSRG